MRLRDQQEEVDSLSLEKYTKREISEMKELMHRSYEDQLKRITEMVFHFSAFSASIFLFFGVHLSLAPSV